MERPQTKYTEELSSFAEDERWMGEALRDAREAGLRGEVPIGAVLVGDGRILGRGGNATEALQDPTVHAEMLAIRQAAAVVGSRRLLSTTLYATLEPCAMCAGAIVLARIPRLVFAADDAKTGACGSLRNVVEDSRLNHRCEVRSGVLAEECSDLLKDFFAALRSAK